MTKPIWAACILALSVASVHAQLLIGQTAGFSGPVAAGVKETTDGAKLYINAVNAKGGVNGQKIELLSIDDKFDPKQAGENARILIEEKKRARFVPDPRNAPHAGDFPAHREARRRARRPVHRCHGLASTRASPNL